MSPNPWCAFPVSLGGALKAPGPGAGKPAVGKAAVPDESGPDALMDSLRSPRSLSAGTRTSSECAQ